MRVDKKISFGADDLLEQKNQLCFLILKLTQQLRIEPNFLS